MGPTLTFDFPAVSIGVAEYGEGPTGCTVFLFESRPQTVLRATADLRGAMHATIFTERLQGGDHPLHAACAAVRLARPELPLGLHVIVGQRKTSYAWRPDDAPVEVRAALAALAKLDSPDRGSVYGWDREAARWIPI